MKVPSKKSTTNKRKEHNVEKYIQGLHDVAVFIRLAVYLTSQMMAKSAKSCEIPRKLELTAVQGHPRSSILVSIESANASSY